jgi:RNA polymerase sigma factor (sigma-70 family)
MTREQNPELSVVFERIQAGDMAARNELMSTLYDRIIRLTAVLLRTFPVVQRRREVESVANDLSLKLIGALDAGLKTGSVQDFFRFAGVRLRQLLIDEAEKHRRRHVGAFAGAGTDTAAPDFDPGTDTLDPEALAVWSEFHEKVNELPEEERMIFEMHFFLQMPQAEIAKVLQWEPKQVSRRWLKACMALADYVPSMD